MLTLREISEILKHPETNAEIVAAALEGLSSFEEGPSLQFMYLPLSAPIHLFKALENNQTITSLTLESHILGEALDALMTALKKNKHLKYLNIKLTASLWLLEELAELLENNQTQIAKLSLGLGRDAHGQEWIKARAFARALEKNHTLTSLCLYGSDALIQILESLSQNKTITELELPLCIKMERVMPVLDSLLKENHTLTKLNLYNNCCDIAMLVESLKDNKSITTLILGAPRDAEKIKLHYALLTQLLKVNEAIIHLDADSVFLEHELFNPVDMPGIQEAYDNLQRALKENQIKVIMEDIQKSVKPHQLGEIKPVLNIIATYVGGFPDKIKVTTKENQIKAIMKNIQKAVKPHQLGEKKSILKIIAAYVGGFPEEIEAIKPPESATPPPPLLELISASLPPKQPSALDKLKQKLHAAWNKLSLIIHSAWNAFKIKFKLATPPHTTQVPDNHTSKPILIPSQIQQAAVVLPAEQIRSQTNGAITEPKASNTIKKW